MRSRQYAFSLIIGKLLLGLMLTGSSIVQGQTKELSKVINELQPKAGDVLTQQNKDGSWSTIKILEVDQWPDGTSSAHCMIYNAVQNKPNPSNLNSLEVKIWHAPISAKSFEHGYDLITNEPVQKSELIGFIEYLKLTDFPRYVKVTGQDLKTIVQAAKEHYLRANSLCEKGNRSEGILEYTKAIDLFPYFFEAIDNRAFTHMELGQFKEALHDFEQSLSVNPSGLAAFFSKGECLMKLGNLAAAEAVFSEGCTKFPEKKEMFTKFLAHVRQLRARP